MAHSHLQERYVVVPKEREDTRTTQCPLVGPDTSPVQIHMGVCRTRLLDVSFGTTVIFLLNLMIGTAITVGFGYWGWRIRKEYHPGLGTGMLVFAGFGVVYLLVVFLTVG